MNPVTEFTPLASIAGGALIGLAAVLLMALHGRILGATGILSGLMRGGDARDWQLRAALVAGMVLAPVAILALTGWSPAITIPVSRPAIVVGGLIVGVGVSYGGGCTSGHGVCGNARFSRRSIVATASFMATAFVTVFVIRHLIGA
ncbi:YeeE/YedE family protein [Frigidibacter sp. MR17.14]|uniref:YeeE/YedE family protein n=1 Tax=Frigidibacter sp. MR17.14 TaxID=3126509 RepID=UPI003012FE82